MGASTAFTRASRARWAPNTSSQPTAENPGKPASLFALVLILVQMHLSGTLRSLIVCALEDDDVVSSITIDEQR